MPNMFRSRSGKLNLPWFVAHLSGLALVLPLAGTVAAQTGTAVTRPNSSGPLEAARPRNIAAPKSATDLIGATVVSKDGRLIGVVDDVQAEGSGQAQTLIVGLGGFLGLGEKDVSIPASGIQVRPRPPHELTEELSDSIYAGASQIRIIVPMTLNEITQAPPYTEAQIGSPSRNSGTPPDVRGKEPPSSTKSGGPG
jgi:sporulation protein YlmC with PRC-barrel domain